MTPSQSEIDVLKAQMPLAFRAAPEVRFRRALAWTVLALLTAWCLYTFDFSPLRIWEGLARLGTVLSFMFPPHIHFNLVSRPLSETARPFPIMFNPFVCSYRTDQGGNLMDLSNTIDGATRPN